MIVALRVDHSTGQGSGDLENGNIKHECLRLSECGV